MKHLQFVGLFGNVCSPIHTVKPTQAENSRGKLEVVGEFTASVASGVTSLGAGPVPPVVTTSEHPSSSTCQFHPVLSLGGGGGLGGGQVASTLLPGMWIL